MTKTTSDLKLMTKTTIEFERDVKMHLNILKEQLYHENKINKKNLNNTIEYLINHYKNDTSE